MASATIASERAHEPVAAWRDALEVWLRTSSTGRKAAVDRIPEHGMTEQTLNSHLRLAHAHRTTSRANALMTALSTTPLPATRSAKAGSVRPVSSMTTPGSSSSAQVNALRLSGSTLQPFNRTGAQDLTCSSTLKYVSWSL